MTSHRLRSAIWRTLGASLALALLAAAPTAARAQAKSSPSNHQQFPAKDPAIKFDLPLDWVVDQGNANKSMLICSVKGHPDIGLLCLSLPETGEEDFETVLPGLAREQLEKQKLADVRVVSRGGDQTNGLPYFFVIASGKAGNKQMSVTFLALEPARNRSFLIEYAVPVTDGPAHMKDFQAIVTSLAAVK